ncbi:LysR substrate-binding domain-containing protein [Dyella jiangningensis]|uniref:LysR family transcriptional regulator n=1 Tax=Dyella jiangningensis TaxID=1379159 RepID=UPI0024104E6B|nr:LysR family transcriptional regulator [Dyella jiangningensis]MDG2536946.1 LysR substrate-binding domain-containing protein [Dyella jiangningensis]
MFPTSHDKSPRIAADYLASSFTASYAGVVAFIAVAAEGSFARAADRLGVGRSAISRSIQKLEAQLNARLFLRTTRSTTLTREGELFYENCHPGVQRIVQALEDMRDLRSGPPRGHLRIGASMGFGRGVVAPLLADFRARYPGISLDLLLDDRPTDFMRDRVDVAIRDGRLEDSQIVAKRLLPMPMLVCASPAYVRRYGKPQGVEDLSTHACISFRSASGRIVPWEFKVDSQNRRVSPPSACTFNDTGLVLQSVLDGFGIAQLAGYQVTGHLRDGRLVTCLEAYAPDDRGHYLCYLSRRHLPARIRVFVDYLTDAVRALDLWHVLGMSVPA